MDLGLFDGWTSTLGAPVEAMVSYPFGVLLRVAGKTTVGTARVLDLVSTAAMRNHKRVLRIMR